MRGLNQRNLFPADFVYCPGGGTMEKHEERHTVSPRTRKAGAEEDVMSRKTRIPLLVMSLFLGATVFAKPMHITPSMIPTAIDDQLKHAKISEHGQVEAKYDSGTAILTGAVDSLGAKRDAERAVRKLADVTHVVNNISVRTDDVNDGQILEKARKEIVTYYAYGIFDNLNLSCQNNELTVSGQVTQPFKKSDIGNFLEHIKGVAALDNQIEVLPTSIYDDRLRLALARAIYGDPYFVHYRNQPLPPIHIIVKNGNVALEGVVATNVDRAKAESNARFAATFFGLTDNLRVEAQKAA